jgi:internalin A
MSNDLMILKELEKEIGTQLPQRDQDEIRESMNLGYAVDDRGYVVGVSFSGIKNLNRIPETLLKFNRLEKLGFIKGGIRDFSELEKLPNLISLTIWDNPIDDISFLQGLSRLTTLDLFNNHFTDISALQGLRRLTTLKLFNNDLTDISALQELNWLTTLYLSGNRFTDISVLQRLSDLTTLVLSDNHLTDIFILQELTKLTRLDLRNNQIKQLPEALVDLGMEIYMDEKLRFSGDKGIFLYDNPLETPPPEIIRKGKDAVKAYFRSLEKGELPLNEAKVILVGDGGAGKTSLVKRLVGKPFDENEPKTHGINIDRWEVKHQKSTIKINTWDFGGKEIMHHTHQFFLSRRSLYILVLDSRKDEKTEYWLKHIRSFGGDSPILVVLNKIDQNPSFEVNRRFLREKYSNIKDFFRLSCADNTGIDEFKKALQSAMGEVEIIRTTWAENWFHVKQQLETMNAPFISLDRYREICEEEEIDEQSGQDTLVDFLHDLGIVLHFDDLGLKDVHVLEPKWVTEAVYKLINSSIAADSKGILNPACLGEILKQQKETDYDYPPDKHHYIIELMKKFELCYPLEKGDILIPDLLAVEQPEFEFDEGNSLKFIFEYDFLPPSVMPRFIVRMHNGYQGLLPLADRCAVGK